MFSPPAKVARTERVTTTSVTMTTATTTRIVSTTAKNTASASGVASSYSAEQFNARRTGTSTRSFANNAKASSSGGKNVALLVDNGNLPICGMGKQLAWNYAPGSKHINVFDIASGKKIVGGNAEAITAINPNLSTALVGGIVPVMKPHQGEVAFVAECEVEDKQTGKSDATSLVYCSSLGTVLSADTTSIALTFEIENEDGDDSSSSPAAPTVRQFDIRSFATASAKQQIAAPMFHDAIPPAQHIIAGTDDGYLLCAFKTDDAAEKKTNSHNKKPRWEVLFCNVAVAEAECAPSIAADLDLSGGGEYLLRRQGAKVPSAAMKKNPFAAADTASNATSKASNASSWWKSWIPGVVSGSDNKKKQKDDNDEDAMGLNDDTSFNDNDAQGASASAADAASLGATGSSKVLAKLRNKRVEHVQPAQNGIIFAVGGEAIAFATKVAASAVHADNDTDDADASLDQNGLQLVWSCPITAIVSPTRPATVAAVTTLGSTVYALVLSDENITAGHLVAINAHNGSLLMSRAVALPEDAVRTAITTPTAASDAFSLPRIDIAVSELNPSNGRAATVSVVVGSTLSHFSLQSVSAHNPCVSTDVETLSEEIFAATAISNNGDDNNNAATSRSLYVLTKDGPFRSEEAAELDAARARQQLSSLLDTIRHDASRLSADEAVLTASDAILYSAVAHADNWARVQDYSSAREDLNLLTFVSAQLHDRQVKHRVFVQTVLGCAEIVEKISPVTIARLISDQEKILALRYIRDLQNADPRDGLHETMQNCIRRAVVTIGNAVRANGFSRLAGFRKASNAEVFFADHNSVVDLMEWAVEEIQLLSQSANCSVAAKVDAAVALGNLCPRILEAAYESRNTILVPDSMLPLMWTSLSNQASDKNSKNKDGRRSQSPSPTAVVAADGAAAADTAAAASVATTTTTTASVAASSSSGCFVTVQQLCYALSDILESAARFNINLSSTHNSDIKFAVVAAAANGNSPIAFEAQQALLSIIDSLLQHTLRLDTIAQLLEGKKQVTDESNDAADELSPFEEATADTLAGSSTFDYGRYINTSGVFAERLLTRTLLRQPFLIPAHVSPTTGQFHMYGYPYGAPKPNPSCAQLATVVLKIAEAFAVKFKVYRLLFVFSLSDPNAIENFIDAIESAAGSPTTAAITSNGQQQAQNNGSPTAEIAAAAAARYYGKYQQYCNTVNGFFIASLHLFLLDGQFQREHEVCHCSKFCGLDREIYQPSLLRNLFLKNFAPHLLWVAVPEFVDYIAVEKKKEEETLPQDAENNNDEDDDDNFNYIPSAPVGGEAAFALLREGATPGLHIPAGDTALAHRSSCAALARLCWYAYRNNEEEIEDGDDDDDAVDVVDTDVGGVYARAQHKKNAFGSDVSRKINADLVVVGFQNKFFSDTHANSILAAPELVKLLLALPDNVDAWRAAAVVCDAIGYAHGAAATTANGDAADDEAENNKNTAAKDSMTDDEAAAAVGAKSSPVPHVVTTTSSSFAAAALPAASSSSAPSSSSLPVAELVRKVYSKALAHDGGVKAILKIHANAVSESEASKRFAATSQGKVILASHALSGLPQASPPDLNPANTAAIRTDQINANNWSVSVASPHTSPSATSAAALIRDRALIKHAAIDNIGTILGPLFSASAASEEEAQKAVKILSDWVAYYRQNGGRLVAPSPSEAFCVDPSEPCDAVEDGMPQ